jgi:hypothetical protein
MHGRSIFTTKMQEKNLYCNNFTGMILDRNKKLSSSTYAPQDKEDEMTKIAAFALLGAGTLGDLTPSSHFPHLPESLSCALLAAAISLLGYSFRRK